MNAARTSKVLLILKPITKIMKVYQMKFNPDKIGSVMDATSNIYLGSVRSTNYITREADKRHRKQ